MLRHVLAFLIIIGALGGLTYITAKEMHEATLQTAAQEAKAQLPPLPAAPIDPDKTFNAQSFTLDNGMQVVVIPNHRAAVVSHMVWYHIGAADEPAGKSGIAHFLEHLMFKGTKKMPDGHFSQAIAGLGGNDNAFTSYDYTAYFQTIGTQHLGTVMEMEADRMKNLVLTEAQVLSERDVIIEERRQRTDNSPQAVFAEQLNNALYINHPYAKPIIGWMHEMQQLTQQDAIDFYRAWYAPDNAVLIVAGDVDAEAVRALAIKHYGPLKPSGMAIPKRPLHAPIRAERRLSMQDPQIGAPVVQIQFLAPRGDHAAEVLAEIIGGGSTARLYRTMVINDKIAISAGAHYDQVSRDISSFTLYATPAEGIDLKTLETALRAQVAELIAAPVTPAELQSAKARIANSAVFARDSLQGPPMIIGRALMSGFTLDDIEYWARDIRAVSAAEVQSAAQTIFAGIHKPVIGTLLPGTSPVFPDATPVDISAATGDAR